jgi:hypothetical protein
MLDREDEAERIFEFFSKYLAYHRVDRGPNMSRVGFAAVNSWVRVSSRLRTLVRVSAKAKQYRIRT